MLQAGGTTTIQASRRCSKRGLENETCMPLEEGWRFTENMTILLVVDVDVGGSGGKSYLVRMLRLPVNRSRL